MEDLERFPDEVRERDLSRRRFETLSPTERAATVGFVQRVLEVLAHTAPEWIDEALVLDQQGDLLEIRIECLKTTLADETEAYEQMTEREARELLRRAEEEFGESVVGIEV
jgi:hypothetical protein